MCIRSHSRAYRAYSPGHAQRPTPTFGHDVGGQALGIGLGYSHALYARLWDRMRQQRLLRRLRRLREQRTSACLRSCIRRPKRGSSANESLPPAPDA